MTLVKYVLILILGTPWLVSCGGDAESSATVLTSAPNVVEVRAIYDPENNLHLFETDTQVIPSG